MPRTFFETLCVFLKDRKASVTTFSALCIIPLAVSTGVAVDLGRTLKTKVKLQAALDAAVISGVTLPAGTRNTYATSMFDAQSREAGITIPAPTFVTNPDKSYSGTVSVSVPTTLMKIVGQNKVDLVIRARAAAPIEDNSCILSLGQGMSSATDSMTFNGASNVDLSGCTLRSNTAMKCNGHTGNADASFAVGSAPGCANPYPGSTAIPDIHAKLATNITKQCGLASYNLNWTAGTPPSSPQMITVVNGSITEYHVCGTVTLKGSGTLLGSTTADSILVVENGDLVMDKNADITLTRTTIVMTGSTGTHAIEFPNGNGKSATLRLSPGKDTANPWRGVGIYQDPALTTGVDISWGPGANLYADGLLYFPNSDATISGNATSNSSNCTKMVVNTLTSNGAVDLKQSDSGCADIGLKQYKQPPWLLY